MATNTVTISATSPSRLSFLLLLYIGREETRPERVIVTNAQLSRKYLLTLMLSEHREAGPEI